MKNNAINSPSLGSISGSPVAKSLLIGTSGNVFLIGSLTSSGGTIAISNPSDGVINLEQNGGTGDAVLSANNVFTGSLNTFSGAVTDMQKASMIYAAINGPSVVTSSSGFASDPSSSFTSASFTLTGSQVVNIGVKLNGGLATQSVFMPTATDFETALLSSFPGGSSIPVFTTYWMRVVNVSSTATATLTANTNFLIDNTTSSVFLPGQRDNVLLVKTANTPEWTVF